MPDRAAVLIDGGYFDKVLNDLGRLRVDFQKFSNKVCGTTERLRTYYYHCMPYQSNPSTLDERQRYSSMDRFMYSLRMLPVLKFDSDAYNSSTMSFARRVSMSS